MVLMLMWHVLLYDSIHRPLQISAHTGLLEHTQPFTRVWALAFKEGTDNECFHFCLSSGAQHRHGEGSPHDKRLPCIAPCCSCQLLDSSRRVRETPIIDECNIELCSMSSTTITIAKFNGTNYAQSATGMALLPEQKQVYGIMKGYDDKLEEPAANATTSEKAALKDWMNRHSVARSTILLGMELRI